MPMLVAGQLAAASLAVHAAAQPAAGAASLVHLLRLGRAWGELSVNGQHQQLPSSFFHPSHATTPAAARPWRSLHTTPPPHDATGSGSRQPGGHAPPSHKLRAVPFGVDTGTARQTFDAYHRQHLLLAKPTAPKSKEAYLPFWVADAQVQVRVGRADVGHRRLVTHQDVRGRWVSEYQTVWQTVSLGWAWGRAYPPTEPAMQHYAARKYPRAQIQRLAPGQRLLGAGPLTPGVLQSSEGGGTRRVGPFQVVPAAAKVAVLGAIRAQEMQAAERQLRDSYNADEVRAVDLRVELVSFALHPVYVPVHVFSSWYQGVKLRTFVSGVDAAAVAGTRVYDRERVALLAGVVGLVAGGLTSGMSAWPYWMGGASVAGWLAAFLHPLVAVQLHSAAGGLRHWWLQRQASRDGGSSGEWDAEFVHSYSPFGGDSQQGGREQAGGQQRRQRTWGGASAGGRDPLGYYRVLGVEPSCSTEELQAAFRGLALRHHPDRYPAAAEKAAATKRFQEITAAYQVLRSPSKRQQYDAGGGA